MKVEFKKLICGVCGREGYRITRRLYSGVTQTVVRCDNCGHEKIEHQYLPHKPEMYSMIQSDDIETF